MTATKDFYKFMMMLIGIFASVHLIGSSHREAPLISNDPLADNTDLYAFRSPDDPNTITIIATYVPLQLSYGGPNYYGFGENIRYEIHVDNDASISGDEVTYRFTFQKTNEDPSTFFNIRLGKQNLKTTYNLERSMDGGKTWELIVQNGKVPPTNIGPRSIDGGAGMATPYATLSDGAITSSTTGEKVFAGPTDDPFFVDLGGIFDLGDSPRQVGKAIDGLACLNVSAIAIQVPISTLLKKGASTTPANILDPNYVIGVWASASRKATTTLANNDNPNYSGDWVQVSRLGMPLTNEAVIAIGDKDYWNRLTPYEEIGETKLDEYFYNPELALYMDDDLFGGAVPSFAPLRIQKKSLGAFDFTNGADGLYGLKGNAALAGTALDDAVFGTLLLPAPGKPRSVDLWPAFHTGVPNVIPYQLATGKAGNPLAAGKPFINNFLPNGGDMLRLNMAVPATQRNDANFSSLGLIQAAVLGLTAAPYNTNKEIEFIPNMDGFPNGRRLEDDVTRIELQAVAGAVLAAVGLWYDDYDPATSASPVTKQLLNVITYTTGVEKNDKPFRTTFPYLALPSRGTEVCNQGDANVVKPKKLNNFFVSSNTSGKAGVFAVNEDLSIENTSFFSKATDADGVYYDDKNDLMIQLNRSSNVLNMYTAVLENIGKGIPPQFVASSTSNFTNGREIAVSGNKVVVLQDANASNNNVDAFVIYSFDKTGFTYDKTLTPGKNLWGAHLDGDIMYAVEDNSNRLLQFNKFFSKSAGTISSDKTVNIDGLVRTHGITYKRAGDVMVLTDIGDAAKADDGAFIVINSYTTKAADGNIDALEQIRVAGSRSALGNPVDIAYDAENGLIHIAERAVNGGQICSFAIPSSSGDYLPINKSPFSGASAIYLTGSTESFVLKNIAQIFASSNTQNKIASINVSEDKTLSGKEFTSKSTDADGLYYESKTDKLYQVDRTNNVINVYEKVNESLAKDEEPKVAYSSTSDFVNGREITAAGDRIVVAEDAIAANGNKNRLHVYQAEEYGITRLKSFDVSINLWGIQADINTLYAVVDNSGDLAIFEDFFGNGDGSTIVETKRVSIAGIARTHGLYYDYIQDLMILTDIGDAASNSDGALVYIKDFSTKTGDNVISADEQIRISGAATQLGNPVDLAYDATNSLIYVAERAGGKILTFTTPLVAGEQAPIRTNTFAGVSAVYLVGSTREGQPTSIADDGENESIIIQAYPNPANNFINIELDKKIEGRVDATIYNQSGQIIGSQSLSGANNKVNISALSAGIYFISLKGSSVNSKVRFVKG